MAFTQSLKTQDAKFESLKLSRTVVDDVVCYSRCLDSVAEKNPILVLIHGYPQSAYKWRHLIPLLPPDSPLFVPDQPGYGGSAPIPSNDKFTIGNALLTALKSQVKSGSSSKIPIVLIGHDRGARIAHRLAVTSHPSFTIHGICLVDIVPTSTQWHHSSSPAKTAKEVTGYFHWPFLANVELATRMIAAYGGAKWCKEMILAWAGSNPTGLSKLQADNSLDVYGGFFESADVVKATCEDYRHGATTDLEAQERDQAEGRKIGVPLLLLYGKDFIGKRYDFGEVWREWVNGGVRVTDHGLGGGIGHFGVEEAPEECARVIGEWLGGLDGEV
ncbi:alpha/beta-hydrolase [Ophiobolus disseminans]|uniref:Alpha/beta-hydrolase n=1 Tax=Ophiobolus disseminans TaxID=1469910 RepID=A0A6A6ZR46_9PLEO|nr:alpha/beta-hydrolase [Ophiobolus disseminans]